jgi:hypothetical protein
MHVRGHCALATTDHDRHEEQVVVVDQAGPDRDRRQLRSADAEVLVHSPPVPVGVDRPLLLVDGRVHVRVGIRTVEVAVRAFEVPVERRDRRVDQLPDDVLFSPCIRRTKRRWNGVSTERRS